MQKQSSTGTSLARQRVAAFVPKHESSSIELLEGRLRRLELEMSPAHSREVLTAVAQQRAQLDELNSELVRELQREVELLRAANERQREYIDELEAVVSEHNLERVGLKQPSERSTTAPADGAEQLDAVRQCYETMTGIRVQRQQPAGDAAVGDKFAITAEGDNGAFSCSVWLGERVVSYKPEALHIHPDVPIPDFLMQEIEFDRPQAPVFFFELAKLMITNVPTE